MMKAKVTIHSFWSGKPVLTRIVEATNVAAIKSLCTTLSRTTDGNPVTYELLPEPETAEDRQFDDYIPSNRWN